MSPDSAFKQYIRDACCVVVDGALATELESRGCNLSSRLWSAKVLVENPELIYQVHLDYFTAGADVATTATYQASNQGLQDAGFSVEESLALIQQSVGLAKRARDKMNQQAPERKCFIAGSVGPYGAYLANGQEYVGNYCLQFDEIKAFHRSRIEALLGAGVDVLACETLPSFPETRALLSVIEEFPLAVAWFSFTLKDEEHISDGTSLSEVKDFLRMSQRVLAIGINCVSTSLVDGALNNLSQSTESYQDRSEPKATMPLIVYPNSGEEYDADSKTWVGNATKYETLEEEVKRWRSLGAQLIGGCCRTTPDDICAIKAAIMKE